MPATLGPAMICRGSKPSGPATEELNKNKNEQGGYRPISSGDAPPRFLLDMPVLHLDLKEKPGNDGIRIEAAVGRQACRERQGFAS
ncbi:hypothetical protein MES4922_40220 [Mesorhizobium ventifaucium]|uniref:Propionyl-coenzyme A carboxylase alpha polypeptide n=1 Tax=Mesorhizobium ventifaucium TaxID=666020 RepID=A0ABN8K567_9HYPH|nr:hypothetical protein MES4922_40220 [Mesorhizobium ventifaucium]